MKNRVRLNDLYQEAPVVMVDWKGRKDTDGLDEVPFRQTPCASEWSAAMKDARMDAVHSEK